MVLSPFGFCGSRRQWVVNRREQPALVSTRAPGARDHKRATGPRVYKSSWNPRPPRATGPRVYKSNSKTGTPGDNQSHRNPDPRLVKKTLDYPSRRALRNVRMKFNGIRDIKDNQSPCLRESDDLDTRRQPANLSTPAQL